MLLKKPIELVWAVPKKQGFTGEVPGLYFHYFRTRSEAKEAERWMKKTGKWIGKTECRLGEAWRAGTIP